MEEKQKALLTIMERENIDCLFIESGFPRYYFLDDQTDFFRSNPHFLFFCPDEGQGHLLKIKPGKKPRLFYHSPQDFWHEPSKLQNEFWQEFFHIEVVSDLEQAWEKAREPKGQNIVISPQPERAMENHCQPASEALLSKIHWLRVEKTEYEIACIREATKKAALGHQAAKKAFFSGAGELEIFHIYLEASGQRESELPYGSIVALNEHAAILHYQKTRSTKNGTSFLIDAGGRYQGYCSDITRTHFTEQAPDLFKELHAGLESIQQSLCQQIQPGVEYPKLQTEACFKISRLLIHLNIFRCSLDQAMEEKLYRYFFPHGLGHAIGIQVHDVCGKQDSHGRSLQAPKDHPYLRTVRKIQRNDVLTVEPGIYFIPMLVEKLQQNKKSEDWVNGPLLEKLQPLGGLRIEDNVLAQDHGPINLTREFLPE